MQENSLLVYTDGASPGNPGEGGIGVVIKKPNGELAVEIGEPVGFVTSNEAEYLAFIRGLEESSRLGARKLKVFVDSELLARQVNGYYRVRHPRLLPLYRRAKELMRCFTEVTVVPIPRTKNYRADQLARAGASQTKNIQSR